MNNKQLTNIIMMIKPCNFGYNRLTALDNVYQNSYNKGLSKLEISKKASLEFDAFSSLLRNAGISVIEFKDSDTEYTPDSIFPNNWISTHSNGTICLYPMFSPNRRSERRQDILDYLENNFNVNNIFNEMLDFEDKHQFLEGTGSMVLDRKNKIAYASISQRTHKELFFKWCKKMNFRAMSFMSKDEKKPIYHTNVFMSICENMVFICLNALSDSDKKKALLDLFKKTKKEVVDISKDQMKNFLGNVLELKNNDNKSFLVMSSSAYSTLNNYQKEIINKKSTILHSPLDTIEYFGGGSARCMIAEIFLEPNFGHKLKYPIFS